MGISWAFEAQHVLNGEMCRSGFHQIGTANHVAHVLGGIVHDDRQVVGPMSVGAQQSDIADIATVERLPPLHSVVPTQGRSFRHAKPPRARDLPRGQSITTHSGVHSQSVDLGQRLPGARTTKGFVSGQQPIQRLSVAPMPLTLVDHTAVPSQSEAFQRAKDVVGCTFHFSGRIQILHPNEPLPTVGFGVKPTCQGGHHGPEMQVSSRRRGKPSDVRTARHHPRTSLRYLMRLGPSSPRRFFRFSSYSL